MLRFFTFGWLIPPLRFTSSLAAPSDAIVAATSMYCRSDDFRCFCKPGCWIQQSQIVHVFNHKPLQYCVCHGHTNPDGYSNARSERRRSAAASKRNRRENQDHTNPSVVVAESKFARSDRCSRGDREVHNGYGSMNRQPPSVFRCVSDWLGHARIVIVKSADCPSLFRRHAPLEYNWRYHPLTLSASARGGDG